MIAPQRTSQPSGHPQKPKRKAKLRPANTQAAADDALNYGSREDAMKLADELAQRHNLPSVWVRETLAQARFIPTIQRLISPPPAGTAKNWRAYRERFIEPRRARAGQEFWNQNSAHLERAQAQFGIPADIIVGIVGVETFYGQIMGSFRVIDALATLSLDFPTNRRDRSAFFRDELGHFLAWCSQQQINPIAPKGSFAGAMGLAQFMPSSLRNDAIDFDGDGRIDLSHSAADAIGSVAHFIQRRGFKPGLQLHFPVAVPVETTARATLLAPDIVPSFSRQEFEQLGAAFQASDLSLLDQAGKLALVELQNGDDAPSYVAGTSNFYALTRYNWSSYYAMAVIDLGATVSALRDADRLRSTNAPPGDASP